MCQPRPNRVTPFGDIVAIPQRGAFMGNRGKLHDDHGQLGQRRWTHKAWITCVLQFKNRQRQIMAPRSYTELFFLDEAVAYAAGHRPCAECRRADYLAFKQAMIHVCPELGPNPKAKQIDALLHHHRRDAEGWQKTYTAPLSDLPDNVFFTDASGRALVKRDGAVHVWTSDGYVPASVRDDQGVSVLTPKPVVDAIKAGLIQVVAPAVSQHFVAGHRN